jgi:hypothetical protein
MILSLLFILAVTLLQIKTVQCEQFVYFIILCFLPYMFRPLLGHHQRGYS